MINIIIPIYNIEKLLQVCLDSIKNQTYHDFRAILVDDGSTDSCGKICDEYSLKDERFITLHKKNGGLSDAVKYGIVNSPQCDYYMFVDGDDSLEPDAVECVEKIISNCSPDMIMYDFFKDYESHAEIVTSNLAEGLYDDNDLENLKKAYQTNRNIVPARWNKAFKASKAVEVLEYYDTRTSVAEDMLFTTLNLFSAMSLFYVKKALVHYYQHEASMVHKYKESYFDSYKIVYNRLKEFFEDTYVPNKVFFQNIKTLSQIIVMYGGTWKYTRTQLERVFSDVDVNEMLCGYKTVKSKDKILLYLMKKKSYRMLSLLAKLNNI